MRAPNRSVVFIVRGFPTEQLAGRDLRTVTKEAAASSGSTYHVLTCGHALKAITEAESGGWLGPTPNVNATRRRCHDCLANLPAPFSRVRRRRHGAAAEGSRP